MLQLTKAVSNQVRFRYRCTCVVRLGRADGAGGRARVRLPCHPTPQSGHRGSRLTGAQKIVVPFSSTAVSVIITPNSIVRMIVSAITDGGQAVASGTGHLGGVDEAQV